MKKNSISFFFLVLNATFIFGQSNIEKTFVAVNAKIGSVDRGYYNIDALSKGMTSDDTNHYSGRVYFFKDRSNDDSLAQFVVCNADGLVLRAYDGVFIYKVDTALKIIASRTPDLRTGVLGLAQGGNMQTGLLVYPPLLYQKKSFDPAAYKQVAFQDIQKEGIIQMMRYDTFPNELKDVKNARSLSTFEERVTFDATNYTLKAYQSWTYSLRSPQYQEIQFSQVVPLSNKINFTHVFNIDSLILAGYSVMSNADYKKLFAPPKIIQAGDTVPNYRMEQLDGDSVSLNQFQNGLILIDFWYRHCGPCLMSTPLINKLHQVYQHKGLAILSIDVNDKNDASFKKFVKDYGIGYPVAFDRLHEFSGKLGVRAYPTFILIDAASQKVIYVREGYAADMENDIVAVIESVLIHK